VLRKDFFSAPEQVAESAAAGASAVLLTLATLRDPLAGTLYCAARERGLEAVVEVHTRAELDRAVALGPTIVGINNRDLLALERDAGDVAVTEALAPLVPEGVVVLSESSLLSAQDVARAFRAGAHAVLVGTAILQAGDVGAALAALMGAERQ
jgi:indole-3-glycerol phosphate synthase